MDDSTLIVVDEGEGGLRMDQLLARRFSEHSRSYFQELISEGLVLLNGQPVKKRVKAAPGDEIELRFVYSKAMKLVAEPMDLDILYEDDCLIVLNKPAGLVVHPGAGHPSGTLVNGLLQHFSQLDQLDPDSPRPGLVHRLDKDTSGVIVVAKERRCHEALVAQFAERLVNKEYLAVCVGRPTARVVEGAIGRHPRQRQKFCIREEGGRAAYSELEPLCYNETLALVKVRPRTGRTHQIRVHLQHVGCPVLGDPVYGSSRMNQRYGLTGQQLHAYQLEFTHPVSKERLRISSPPPEQMLKLIREIDPHFTLESAH